MEVAKGEAQAGSGVPFHCRKLIFKLLHILSMFAMVTVFLGGDFFLAVATRQRDVRALAWVERTGGSGFTMLGFVALIAGIVFGLLTAATGGLDFLKGWLIAAYVLVVLFLINVAVLGKRVVRVGREAVDAEAGRGSTEEVVRATAGSPAIPYLAINVAIFAAIIADMVLKPF